MLLLLENKVFEMKKKYSFHSWPATEMQYFQGTLTPRDKSRNGGGANKSVNPRCRRERRWHLNHGTKKDLGEERTHPSFRGLSYLSIGKTQKNKETRDS